MFFFSVLDIFSDYYLFSEYAGGQIIETLPASTTLAFIYLSSLNVLATLYGPSKVGALDLFWGVVMAGVGVVLILLVLDIDGDQPTSFSSRASLALLLGIDGFWGMIMMFNQYGEKLSQPSFSNLYDFLLSGLMFPLLFTISPLIFVCSKFLQMQKPNNKLLKAQTTMGRRIRGAAPQFALQCWIVLLSLTPTWSHWFSLITSALTLITTNIEHFVTEEKKAKSKREYYNFIVTSKESEKTFGPMSILKNIAVFLPASLFRILSVSILFVFFDMLIMYILLGYCIVLAVFLEITTRCYKLRERDGWQQFWECWMMSFLTMTNLGRGKTAALYRMVSSFFWTIIHTITLLVILGICNTDPVIVSIGNDWLIWSKLALVQDLITLNALLISTISMGWLALVADVITAAIRYRYQSFNLRYTQLQHLL